MTTFVKRQSVCQLKKPHFLKNVENTLTNGVLFPEKYYLCNADRCVRMQPLAEKCFSLNRSDRIKSPKTSKSSLKVLGISTPLFCITEGILYVHSIYITVRALFSTFFRCELRCLAIPSYPWRRWDRASHFFVPISLIADLRGLLAA